MDVTHYRADCSITDWNLLPVDMAAVLPIILVMASVTPRCRHACMASRAASAAARIASIARLAHGRRSSKTGHDLVTLRNNPAKMP